MKKFLGILAIAGVLVACDNSASNEQRVKDSTDSARRADSINAASAVPATPPATGDTGTTVVGDTSTKAIVDTTTKQ